MLRLRTIACCVLSLGLIVSLVPRAQAAPAAVLDVIPQNAWGAVVLRDLGGLNKKIIAFGQELGLPIGPGTMVGDPLMMAKGMLGVAEGIDDNGSAALVLLPMPEPSVAAMQESVVLLVPCTDAKVFLEQFAVGGGSSAPGAPGAGMESQGAEQNQETPPAEEPAGTMPTGEEPAAEAPLPEGVIRVEVFGQESFAAPRDKYAVLAPSPKAVKAFLDSQGSMRSVLPKERLAEIDNKVDLLIWLNVAEAGPVVKKPVVDAMMGFMMIIAMSDPSIGTQVEKLVHTVEQVLTEGENMQLGIAISQAGVNLDLIFQAQPDTELAKGIAKTPTSDTSLLRGLPDEDFILAAGGTEKSSAEDVEAAMTGFESIFQKPAILAAIDADKLPDLKESIRQLCEIGVNGEWGSISVTRLPASSDGMIGLVVTGAIPGGAEKWVQVAGDVVQKILGMITDEDVRSVTDHITYTPNAETIGGAKVDHIKFDLSWLVEDETLTEDDLAMIGKIIGSEGVLVRLVAFDADHVGLLFGGGPKRVEQVAQVLKSGTTPLADHASLQAIAPNLRKNNRFFEMYLAADTTLQFVNDAAVAVGEDPLPVEIPKINAPAAIIGTIAPLTGRVDVFVPMQMISGIKNVATGLMAEQAVPLEMEEMEESEETETETAPAPAEAMP